MCCIGPKLCSVDLKDVSLAKDALRDILDRGFPFQLLKFSTSTTRKINMTWQFLKLHTMNMEFNVYIISLPGGCFSSMPKLRRISMSETRIANSWTRVAALSWLPSLSKFWFIIHCVVMTQGNVHCLQLKRLTHLFMKFFL